MSLKPETHIFKAISSTTVEIQYEFETEKAARKLADLQQQKFSMSLKHAKDRATDSSTTVEIQYEFETHSLRISVTNLQQQKFSMSLKLFQQKKYTLIYNSRNLV